MRISSFRNKWLARCLTVAVVYAVPQASYAAGAGAATVKTADWLTREIDRVDRDILAALAPACVEVGGCQSPAPAPALVFDGLLLARGDDSAAQGDTNLDLKARQWALWGGLLGHALWMSALAVIATGDSSYASFEVGAGLLLASAIVPAIAHDSAVDNVGVRGAPGQKISAWVLFGFGVVGIAAAFGLRAAQDIENSKRQEVQDVIDNEVQDSGLEQINTVATDDVTQDRFLDFADTTFFTFVPFSVSYLAGALMSSAALRANRQVRRAKRRSRAAQEALADVPAVAALQQPGPSWSVNSVPLLGRRGKAEGMMANLSLRF